MSKRKLKFERFMAKELKKEKRTKLFSEYKKFENTELLTSFPKMISKPHNKRKGLKDDFELDIEENGGSGKLKNRVMDDSCESLIDSFSDDDNIEVQVPKVDAKVELPVTSKHVDSMDSDAEKIVGPSAQVEIQQKKSKKKKRKRKEVIKEVVVPTVEFTPLNQTLEKSYFVLANRTEEIQQQRLLLPVVGEEQAIMEAINKNDVVILCAQTGSGKTTQVPQFLYEAGFGDKEHPLYKGIVGITQPRRVAAVSMANRVGQELNNPSVVSYQVRYNTTISKNTRIAFMTDGILLRELSIGQDMLLQKYSCIIIDEAHERTVGTDILIGWLSRIVKLRNSGRVTGVGPLKLVIMSATLRVEDFTDSRLFDKVPVLEIPGRQHKVVVHYNKVTEDNYLEEIIKKVTKIHTKLAGGGILVFVTGQSEVQFVCQKLKELFGNGENHSLLIKDNEPMTNNIFNEADDDYENLPDDFDVATEFEEGSDVEEEETHILAGNIDDEDEDVVSKDTDKKLGIHVLPLYSLLPTTEQLKVFHDPPPNTRLIVVATNVAETSLTIPGINYVVDCGKEKQRDYDTQTGIQKFQIQWTSAASADQRAGRAGRTGPGHCYRLYSSAVFTNYFSKFSKPEIDRIPLQGVVLNLKALGIKSVLGFPFPTAPDEFQLKDAETILTTLGAIDEIDQGKGVITPLGQKINLFPISPRLGKMLVVSSAQPELCPMVIAAVAGMSVGQLFIQEMEVTQNITENMDKTGNRTQYFKKMMGFAGNNPTSDLLMMLKAIGAYHAETSKKGDLAKFCKDNYLRQKAMEEVMKLYRQLCNIMESGMGIKVENLLPPTSRQESQLLQIFLTGYPDCVARLSENNPHSHGPKAVPVYETGWSNETEYFVIHPGSCLSRVRPPPKFVIYDHIQAKQELLGTDNTVIELEESNKPQRKYLKIVSAVDITWLADQEACANTGKLLDLPQPCYKRKDDCVVGFVSPTYGQKLWPLPVTEKRLDNLTGLPYFAQALLEGKTDIIGNFFSLLAPTLNAKPTILTKSWAKIQKKVDLLLNALHSENVNTRRQLIEKWKQNPQFLLTSYLLWIPEILHKPLKQYWPPVVFKGDKVVTNPELLKTLTKIIAENSKNRE